MKELTKKDTKVLQCLSVIAMVLLHLFCTYDYADKYTPVLFFGGVPLCFYIAQLLIFVYLDLHFAVATGIWRITEKTAFTKAV